jgi:hypothetical protein
MNVKKAVKKIVALGTGATIMGATVLGAMAADLANFPAPFVKNGAYDAWIVVGEAAQVPDVIGSVNIAMRLQYEMKTPAGTGGSSSTVTVSGDAAQVKTPTDSLEFTEYLGEVKEVFTDADLSALEDGSISNNKGTFSYNQYIDVPSNAGFMVKYVEDSDRDETADYLYVADSANIYTYNLEFPTPLESDIDASDNLDDLEDKSITMLGKTYTVTNTDVSGTSVTIELMGGDVSDTLYEGETKTYSVNGKDYEVTATYIGTTSSTTKVKFSVTYDGKTEVTSSLASAETYVLDDKTEIGVREALEQNDYSGTQKDFVEFYMGANKMILKDTDFTSSSGGQSLEVGSDTISDVTVKITADNSTASLFKLSKIQVVANSPDDIYVPMGGKYSEELASDKKGTLFTQNMDFTYEGLTAPATEEVRIKNSGDTKYTLTFTNKAGETIDVPLLYASGSTTGYVGDDDGSLHVTEEFNKTNGTIDRKDYFVLGDISKDVDKRYTYVMQYKSFDADTNEIVFENLGSGETVKYTLDSSLEANILLGGKQFLVKAKEDLDNANIWVDLDGDGTNATTVAGEVTMNLTTKSGAWMQLPDQITSGDVDPSSDIVKIWFPTGKMDDKITSDYVSVGLDVAATEVDLAAPTLGNSVTMGQIGTSDTYQAYSAFGAFVENDRPSSSPDTLVVTIPTAQVEGQVFVTSGAVTKTLTSTEEAGTTYNIAPVSVGSAKLDSESAGWKSQNTIIVGGPCANTVAAEFMGSPADCATGFEEGKAKIMLKEYGSKVSMLVAGYSADDTVMATKVVAEYDKHAEFTGSEVEVSGTSMNDITVSAPTETTE